MIHSVLLILLLVPPGHAAMPGAESAGRVTVGSSSTELVWECPEIEPLTYLPDGLAGYTAFGCGYSGTEGSVLLPAREVFLAIPPGAEHRLEVVAEGVRTLGTADAARVDVSDDGVDVFSHADAEELPVSWAKVLDTGTFRRAGFARVRLHPVISRGGELQAASRLSVRLTYSGGGRPSPARGFSGVLFEALFEGGNLVWESPPERRDTSPFWGLPWYALRVDTAGIYRVAASDVPMAQGVPSASLALYTGRGREMGDQPWLHSYTPRPVPVLVDDGGDGIFDGGDSFYFFGRGLAWWESSGEEMPEHFNHPYDDTNVYWLTWGGENGVMMEVESGGLTGAPAMPDSFLSRRHLELNQEWVRGIVNFSDDWAWLRSQASTDTWHYFDFDAPGAAGSGYVRLCLASKDFKRHRIRLYVNSALMLDTSWTGNINFVPLAEVEGLQEEGNSLAVQIVREEGSDTVYLDWIDVFWWTEGSTPGQTHVPLEWSPGDERRLFTWDSSLEDALVFLVGGDTLARSISVEDPYGFEFEIPSSWEGRELWISEPGEFPAPSVTREDPGRIKAAMGGAACVYVAADDFFNDVAPLAGLSGDALSVSTSEVYQEFNGGIRDPGAIRAMVSYMVDTWDPVPMDLVLVGGGTWDPRNFVSSRISHIDILYRGGTSLIVADDEFAIVEGAAIPQMALSRMAVRNRTDLQFAVSRSIVYRSGDGVGEWQTTVIGAADDERSPLHNNDERYHTQSVERLLTNYLPGFIRPEKMYLIFYDWDSMWSKPQARNDYIDLWSGGALVSFFLGHGSFDQLADEGLLFLEDAALLACGPRLPLAIFASCDVGRFQNPSAECLGQQVTVSPAGGAILGLAATDKTNGPANETFVGQVLDHLFSQQGLSTGACVLMGKLSAGYNTNQAQYILFGDGSIPLAVPWEVFDIEKKPLLSGELNTLEGDAPSEGLIFVNAWESCRPDTYYTFRQSLPIEYLSVPGRFYSGTSIASPGYTVDMFIPVDSDTGELARTQLTLIDGSGIRVASTYPGVLGRGSPSQDGEGPEMELWIEGYRNVPDPVISGEVVVCALLSDTSGINLLGNVGRQLALYVDGIPLDVSDHFQYHTGSSTTGGFSVNIGTLQPGEHTAILRAADGLLNISEEEIGFSVTGDNILEIHDVFPYPNPCSGGTSINWTQTSPGRVDISIYTVAGRRVRFFGNLEGGAGYNQCWWDGRDADGDPVASGTYIFVISAAASSGPGRPSRATGIIALVRDGRP